MVVGVAKHSETEEPHVVYHREGAADVGAAELWIRPLAMWT